eukprot:5840899-Prymnesium_polylepis.1
MCHERTPVRPWRSVRRAMTAFEGSARSAARGGRRQNRVSHASRRVNQEVLQAAALRPIQLSSGTQRDRVTLTAISLSASHDKDIDNRESSH